MVLVALLGSGFVGCGGSARNSERYFRAADHSPEVQDNFVVFARRCSKCHSLARPLVAGVTNVEHWDHYVARMVRQPGSGITPRDVQPILAFLYYYTLEVRGLGDPADQETLPTPPPEGTDASITPAPTPPATSAPHTTTESLPVAEDSSPAAPSVANSDSTSDAVSADPARAPAVESPAVGTTQDQGEVQ